MASMQEVTCICGKAFEARTADIKRGWGKFCSKSCKARKQTKDTGIAGPDYRAVKRTVHQMKSGHYAKSKFAGKRRIPRGVTHDEFDNRKECFCGCPAKYFVNSGFGHNGWEGLCEDHKDYT